MQPHLHLLVPEGGWSGARFLELVPPSQQAVEGVLKRMLAQARTWGVDVWRCPCGGERKVTAIVTSRRAAEEILRNLGLLPATPPRLVALPQAPPQLELPIA